jgi:hypothetical protein
MDVVVAQSVPTLVELPRNVSSLPTDSMVTVRLSDAQIQPIVNHSARASKRSSSVNSNASNVSARSSTRSSTPSNTTVDWEELEKSEEQEPRDQTTDEVCWKVVPIWRQVLTQPVYCSSAGSIRTRECGVCRQPKIWPWNSNTTSSQRSSSIYPAFEKACQWPSTAQSTIFAPSCSTNDRARILGCSCFRLSPDRPTVAHVDIQQD